MRLVCFLFLVVFVGAVGLLAYQNQQEVSLMVLSQSVTTGVAILVGVAYLAGMRSGWTVVGMLRRSLKRVIHEPHGGKSAG